MKKKIMILALATALLCMTTACNNKDKNKNPGSMADNSSSQESSTQNNDGGTKPSESDMELTENTTNKNDSNGITGTGGANGNDNVSLWDNADNSIGDMIDDAADGITDMTDNLFGGTGSNANQTPGMDSGTGAGGNIASR